MSNSDDSVVQLIFTQQIYKREKWTVPIHGTGENFNTGQKLTYRKQTGIDPLTPEEVKLYPFVIDPHGMYKVADRQRFHLDRPEDQALHSLIIQSGFIAKDKGTYDQNPAKYKGYFYDKVSEAKTMNDIDDMKFEAESHVRNLTSEERRRLGMLLNYKVNIKDFHISTQSQSDEVLRRELVLAAKDYPKQVLSCFEEFNPGISQEAFIIECIHYHLLDQKPNGDIYYGSDYLGSSIDEVVKQFSKESRKQLVNRLGVGLDEIKGHKPLSERKVVIGQAADVDKMIEERILRFKASILDENVEAAKEHLSAIRELHPQGSEKAPAFDYVDAEEKIRRISPIPDERATVKSSLKAEYAALSLDQLHAKITHHMTPFNKEDCVDFWDDAGKLVEYMIDVKLNANVV